MKYGPKLKNTEAGFTLVEIMIAVCIFSVGLLAIASMQMSGTQGTARARCNTEATVWASDRVEKLISLPYDHADLTNGAHGPVTEDRYTINWTVADNLLMNNIKTITVSVTWDDNSMDRTVSFTYYKADI
ncbi:putative PilV [uncultured Desulfobacterium sp.]|uniref:Putative PilV n=1 Tax=uncultured Desulfobacterium sp. TaxID=201089 RepID=A0A445N3N6_9BACT|nr:putative PilV [uncultured Desulfobacterium sp.]